MLAQVILGHVYEEEKHRLRFIQINFQHYCTFYKSLTERSRTGDFYTQSNYPQTFSYKRYRQAQMNTYDSWSINLWLIRKMEEKPPTMNLKAA